MSLPPKESTERGPAATSAAALEAAEGMMEGGCGQLRRLATTVVKGSKAAGMCVDGGDDNDNDEC